MTAIYLGFFTLSLLYSRYPLTSSITLLVATALLVVLGWKNPPINAGEELCILYRSGFIPLYASSFVLLAWLYKSAAQLLQPYAAAGVVAVVLATYLISKIVKRIALGVFIASSVAGLILGIIGSYDWLSLAFSLPPLTVLTARPKLLCDDRPLFYIASIYSSALFAVVVSLKGAIM